MSRIAPYPLVLLLLLLLTANATLAAEPAELPIGDTKVFSLAYSSDGKHLAIGTGGSTPTVKVFDVAAKKAILDLPCERRGAGFSVAFSPDGKLIAIADYDLAVTIRKLADGTEAASLPGDPERKKYRQGRRLAFLPGGKSLVVGYSTGEVFVWDVAEKKVTIKFDHGNEITAVAVSSDGRRVATGTGWGFRVWDATDGKPVAAADQKSSGQHEVQALAFLPDGKTIVTSDSPGFVKFYGANDAKEICSFKMPAVGGSTTVYGLGAATDGKTVVVPGSMGGLDPKRPNTLDTGIVLLDTVTAKPRSFVPGISARVLALSPNGKTAALATGDKGDPVFLYDLTNATTIKR